MLLPSAGLLLPLLVLVLLERASATHSSSSPAAAAGPLPPELLRASGSDVHPTTGSVATRFALDPSNGCSFTWAHQAGANRAVVQAAFQLRVWDASTGHVAYDSGFCNSSDPSHYLPAGSLKTARGYVWRVSWWDGDGRASALSNEAAFHVGPDAAGWEGVPWIGANASNVYRATGLPVTEEAATSVILYICALGFGKVTVNGRAADGDGAGRMAVSGWTNNERLNLYETYDLTAVARSSSARNEPIVLGVHCEATEPNCAALNSLWNGYNCIGTVGIIGAKALFPALAAIDRRDLALAILEKTDYPSFGYMRYNTLEPATSNLWELMDAPYQGHSMNSRNHHMWGAFSSYLVSHVAGLDQHSHSFGYKHLRLTPGEMPGLMTPAVTGAPTVSAGTRGGLSAAAASLALRHGRVEFAWEWIGGTHCSTGADGATIRLACGSGGGIIAKIEHASYGAPEGICGAFKRGETCDHPEAAAAVASRCLGKTECSVPVDRSLLSIPQATERTSRSSRESQGSAAPAAPQVAHNRSSSSQDQGRSSCALDGHAQRLHVQVACSKPLAQLAMTATVPISSVASLELPVTPQHTKLLLMKSGDAPGHDATGTSPDQDDNGGGELVWGRGGSARDSSASLPQGVKSVLEEVVNGDGQRSPSRRRVVVEIGSGQYRFVMR